MEGALECSVSTAAKSRVHAWSAPCRSPVAALSASPRACIALAMEHMGNAFNPGLPQYRDEP